MRIDAPIDPVAHVAIPSLRALARRAVPQALEARSFALRCTSSPHAWPELASAIVAPLTWAIGVVSWRASSGRRVSGMVVLALATLLVRSLIAFAADSTFLHFRAARARRDRARVRIPRIGAAHGLVDRRDRDDGGGVGALVATGRRA